MVHDLPTGIVSGASCDANLLEPIVGYAIDLDVETAIDALNLRMGLHDHEPVSTRQASID